jgi:hypothetical protein
MCLFKKIIINQWLIENVIFRIIEQLEIWPSMNKPKFPEVV